MTVTITIDPRGAGRAVEITDEVKLKLPTAPRGPSLFYATDEFNLTRSDPDQQRLDVGGLREVPARTTKEQSA